MLSPLSKIYRGSYEAVIGSCDPNSPHSKQVRLVEQLENAFKDKLSPELREEFERLRKEISDLSFLEGEEEFTEGFRLGVQLMVIALHKMP